MCLCACVWARCSMRTVQGAGKSTLLNALLNESKLIPTNAMRACTVQTVPPVGRPRRSLRCADVRCGAAQASLVEIRYGVAGDGLSHDDKVQCMLHLVHCVAPGDSLTEAHVGHCGRDPLGSRGSAEDDYR